MNNQSSHEAESIANLLKSVTGGWRTIYISVPITTGQLFLEWYEKEGSKIKSSEAKYKKLHFKNVIEPNCANAKKHIEHLRGIYISEYTCQTLSIARAG